MGIKWASVCIYVHMYLRMYDIKHARIMPIWGGYPQKRIKNKGGGGGIGASCEHLLTKNNKNTHLMAPVCG